ncbi:hypothetical protein [Thermopirellula anaerolimosa]
MRSATRLIPAVGFLVLIYGLTTTLHHSASAEEGPLQPRIVGAWRRIARNPDLSELTGESAQTSVYFSLDPPDFGVDRDEDHFVCTMPIAAPEILRHQDEYFVAALLPSLKGIAVARLSWTTAP